MEQPAKNPEKRPAYMGMTDVETAAHLREWVKRSEHGMFSWPTDACGYTQHIRFVEHRNANWKGSTAEEFKAFVLAYADALEQGRVQESTASGEGQSG